MLACVSRPLLFSRMLILLRLETRRGTAHVADCIEFLDTLSQTGCSRSLSILDHWDL